MNYISATAGEEWHLRATQLLGADRWREQKVLAFVIFIFIRPASDHVFIDLSLTHWLYGWLMLLKLDWCGFGCWIYQPKTCWCWRWWPVHLAIFPNYQLFIIILSTVTPGGEREKAKKNDRFRYKRSSHFYSAGKVRCNDPLLLFVSKSTLRY